MDLRSYTVVGLLVVLAIVLFWDIVVATNRARGDTISEVVLFYARSSFSLPFGWGLLAGHFFWPGERWLASSSGFWTTMVISLAVLLVDGLTSFEPWLLRRYPIVMAVPGLLIGHFLWAQGH